MSRSNAWPRRGNSHYALGDDMFMLETAHDEDAGDHRRAYRGVKDHSYWVGRLYKYTDTLTALYAEPVETWT